jgi:hypothetical protein
MCTDRSLPVDEELDYAFIGTDPSAAENIWPSGRFP